MDPMPKGMGSKSFRYPSLGRVLVRSTYFLPLLAPSWLRFVPYYEPCCRQYERSDPSEVLGSFFLASFARSLVRPPSVGLRTATCQALHGAQPRAISSRAASPSLVSRRCDCDFPYFLRNLAPPAPRFLPSNCFSPLASTLFLSILSPVFLWCIPDQVAVRGFLCLVRFRPSLPDVTSYNVPPRP